MAKYLFKVRYTAEGLQGLLSGGGSARRTAIKGLAEGTGGTVEAFYFALGEEDAYVICDLPDAKSAAAIAMTVSSTGRVSLTTTELLTAEDMDAIAAGPKPAFNHPGR
jgi:uncharacterized protein with GYD domain